jgi:hypothetical protein
MTETEPTWTREEASTLVGLRIITTRPYSGVPAGTTGTVTGFEEGGKRHPDGLVDPYVMITWDLPGRRPPPLTDGFSRADFEFSIVPLYDQPGPGWEWRCRVAVETA